MSEGDLKGYSPPPGDSSSAPNYGCQRRDQHYQPTRSDSRSPPYDPQGARPGYTVFPAPIGLPRLDPKIKQLVQVTAARSRMGKHWERAAEVGRPCFR